MSIYNTVTQPFTYLIGWPKLNKWYYGVRYCNGCLPSDLWSCYFTSSVYVAEFRKLHGEPEIIKIRKIFQDKQTAINWENRVLKRIWRNRNNWINKRFDSTKFVPTLESIEKNIASKKNRSEEKQNIVSNNISRGAKFGHSNMLNSVKEAKSIKIAQRNKERPVTVNLKISETVKLVAAARSESEKLQIEEKKKLTRAKNKQAGITRKPRSHITLCSCLCCKKVMNLGCFANHNKKK